MRASRYASVLVLLLALGEVSAAAELVTTGNNLSVDVSPDGERLAMDLRGDIWLMPAAGGEATRLLGSGRTLSAPRWSSDGTRILYNRQGPDGVEPWIIELADGATRRVGAGHMQDASWHPDGERIVFAAERHDTGLDLWEIDLPTGLSWRLTDRPGDETDPAWSANGRHLAWISHVDDHFELVLRRRGQAAEVLVSSESMLVAPAWRPDGSLLTYLVETDTGLALDMVILSEPILVRRIESAETLAPLRVSWPDRLTMYYSAGRSIRKRGFEDRRSRPVRFSAIVESPDPAPQRQITKRELPVVDPPDGRMIVRGARLFDGVWQGYRSDMDVVIESGRIRAIEARRERDDGVIIDLGEVTVMPGLVDAHSAVPVSPAAGPALLAFGVTTVVVDRAPEFDPLIFERESSPGPRIVTVDGGEHLSETVSVADAGTPGIRPLLDSRQSAALGRPSVPSRRFAGVPDPFLAGTRIAIGSRPNGLAPGLSVHAELRALQAAGLNGEQALHAAGRNPAVILGAEHQVGTLIEGALADLVLVRGDPLQDVSDALNVVAVIRNGRLFSVVNLLERAAAGHNVE